MSQFLKTQSLNYAINTRPTVCHCAVVTLANCNVFIQLYVCDITLPKDTPQYSCPNLLLIVSREFLSQQLAFMCTKFHSGYSLVVLRYLITLLTL